MGRTTQIVSMLKWQMFAKTFWFCELVYYISPNFILYVSTSTLTTCLWRPISNSACAAIALGLNVKKVIKYPKEWFCIKYKGKNCLKSLFNLNFKNWQVLRPPHLQQHPHGHRQMARYGQKVPRNSLKLIRHVEEVVKILNRKDVWHCLGEALAHYGHGGHVSTLRGSGPPPIPTSLTRKKMSWTTSLTPIPTSQKN